jgi:alpha-L-rhamnosidase
VTPGSWTSTRYTAGIRLTDDPAYRSFVVAPVPGGGLTSAATAHESPYGRIESSWELAGGGLALQVRVPPGTTATVVAGGSETVVGPGRREFTAFPESWNLCAGWRIS